jgi:phosphoglycerate dehydrogenase-like enzyme
MDGIRTAHTRVVQTHPVDEGVLGIFSVGRLHSDRLEEFGVQTLAHQPGGEDTPGQEAAEGVLLHGKRSSTFHGLMV